MSQVVDHLAELTGFRDRDVLDVTLVGALKDLVQPRSVAIFRCVGEPGEQRWLTRARLVAGDLTPTADPLWSDLATLPKLDSHPMRYACLQRQEPISIPGTPAVGLFPLATDRDVVGVLEIETDKPMEPEEVRLVSSIMRIYRNFQALLDYSERDTLTGLLNRKTFDESFLRSAIETSPPVAEPSGDPPSGGRRSSGESGPWLGVIDIDHFKTVNDTYGHLIGDEVLLLLSRLMRSSFRFHDRLYRFGGEEFVVLMRVSQDEDAAHAFERLRHNVESYVFPRVGHITVSVGFTEVRPGDSPSAAFERADKAVYYAKQNGRNQVASHGDLIARGLLADESHTGDIDLF